MCRKANTALCLMIAAATGLLWVFSAQAETSDHRDADAIAAAGGAVERIGDRLLLRTKSGKQINLNDGPSCFDHTNADRCFGHRFLSYDRFRGVFVIERFYYEGADHILVDDRSGELTEMQGEPQLSPMGDIVIELVYGESHYYTGEPALNVWRRTNGKFKREWSEPIVAEHGYSVLGWPSNDRVDVEEAIPRPAWIEESGKRVFAEEGTRRLSVIREGQRWRIDRAPLPASAD